MLLAAILSAESGGDHNAVGDQGRAIGGYQIHASVVQDVNRIAGTNIKLHDRYDPRIAEQIAIIYLHYYGGKYERQMGREPTPVVLAAIWNGGPIGYTKPKALRYGYKVQAKMFKSMTERPPMGDCSILAW